MQPNKFSPTHSFWAKVNPYKDNEFDPITRLEIFVRLHFAPNYYINQSFPLAACIKYCKIKFQALLPENKRPFVDGAFAMVDNFNFLQSIEKVIGMTIEKHIMEFRNNFVFREVCYPSNIEQLFWLEDRWKDSQRPRFELIPEEMRKIAEAESKRYVESGLQAEIRLGIEKMKKEK
jgi:hypothetical protein